MGERNIQRLPFHTDVKNVILYHHENACDILKDMAGKDWLDADIVEVIDRALQ